MKNRGFLSKLSKKDSFLIEEEILSMYDKIVEESPSCVEDLEEKYFFDSLSEYFGAGFFGKVYAVDVGKIGKVLYSLGSLKEHFKRILLEYNKQRLADALGIRVPIPYELVLAEDICLRKKCPMFVMKDLGRKVLNTLSTEDFLVAEPSWEGEKNRAKKYLAERPDFDESNAIWVPEEQQTYLIDCDYWYFKGVNSSR